MEPEVVGSNPITHPSSFGNIRIWVVSSVVEHLTFNQVVAGSSLARPTKPQGNLGLSLFSFSLARLRSNDGGRFMALPAEIATLPLGKVMSVVHFG